MSIIDRSWWATLLALLALCFWTPPLYAQEEAGPAAIRAAFDSTVAAHTYTATLEAGALTGPGADWLVARGRGSAHFLLGERHGTAEIPRMAASLYERLAAHGYGPVTLEIGPFAAAATGDALRAGGYPALERLITRYEAPAIPFLNWKEESKMAARMAEAGATIWGVDYEFLFSLPMHLDALAEEAETLREEEAVQEVRSQMEGAWGGKARPALAAADPAAFRVLRSAFEPRGDEAALARIDALLESNAIYAPYVRGAGSFVVSNRRRETLMKEQFISYVQAWERERGETPKVFHKNAHVEKLAPADQHVTFGALVAAWSRIQGGESFHVLADCHGGQIPKTGQGGGGACTAHLGKKNSPFEEHLREDRITVIDLRPLRQHIGASFLSSEINRLIVSWDAYVAIPDVERSEPLTALPRPE